MTLKHLRSSTADKRPQASGMADGQLAINTASGSPGLFFKDTNGSIVKIGPVHVGSGAPNASPASGGTTGNSLGEQWLDTSNGNYVFKIWDGGEWRSETGEFVNASGDTMTGSLVLGSGASLVFEGSTDDGFETTLTVVDPTADRTITLPNVTGTVVTTGDAGTVTSAMLLDGTIVNADVNVSAAIAGTKISPDFGGQTITTSGIVSVASGSAAAPSIAINGDANTGIYSPGTDQLAISTAGSGRLFVDSSGRILAGTSSARSNFFNVTNITPGFQIEQTGNSGSLSIVRQSADFGGAFIALSKSRGTAIGDNTLPQNGDDLGVLSFLGSDGSEFVESARISSQIDGTPGANDMPGRLIFATTSDNAASPTERMRIDSQGRMGLGTTNPSQALQIGSIATGSSTATPIAITLGSTFSDSAATPSKSKLRIFEDNGGAIYGLGVSANLFEVHSAGSTAFYTNGANERLRITSAGLVGIGTSAPVEKLHIEGAGTQTIRLRNSTTGSNASPQSTFIQFYGHQGTGGPEPRVSIEAQDRRSSVNGGFLNIATANTSNVLTNALHIDNQQRVGIGTTSPADILTVQENKNAVSIASIANTNAGVAAQARFKVDNGTSSGSFGICGSGFSTSGVFSAGSTYLLSEAAPSGGGVVVAATEASSTIRFATGGLTERARIDSSGRLLVGTSTSLASTDLLQVVGANFPSISVYAFGTGQEASIGLKNARGTQSSPTVSASGDSLGTVNFLGYDGSLNRVGARIQAVVDGTPGLSDMPGRLVFFTTADGASSPTERLRITSAGLVGIGTTSPSNLLEVAGGNIAGSRVSGRTYTLNNVSSANPTTVNGSGFNSVPVQVGDIIDFPFGQTRTVTAVVSDTQLTVNTAWSVSFAGSNVTGYGSLGLLTNSVNRLHIAAGGNVGIGGTTSPSHSFQVSDKFAVDTTNTFGRIYLQRQSGSSLTAMYIQGADQANTASDLSIVNATGGGAAVEIAGGTSPAAIKFFTNGPTTERARLDSSGRLLVGTSTALGAAKLETLGNSFASSAVLARINSNDTNPTGFVCAKDRAGAIVQNGDLLGGYVFRGYDGSNYLDAAFIRGDVDGTPGANDMPGRLVFATTADGASTPTERMRIDSSGQVLINFSPLKGKTHISDYTNGVSLTGTAATYTLSDDLVDHSANVSSSILYIGNGFILPKAYTNTVTYSYNLIAGAFNLYFESSTDGSTWTTLTTHTGGSSGNATYAFSALASATALRFRFQNSNGTTGRIRVSNIVIPGLTPNQIEQGVGVESAYRSLAVPGIYGFSDTNTSILFPGSDVITFNEGGSEAARIDSSGRLLVGTSSARQNLFNATVSPILQTEGTTDSTRGAAFISSNVGGLSGGYIALCHQKSGSVGGNGALSSGDETGAVYFLGSDGSEFVETALIKSEVDGTPGANDMPGRLVFSTTADGASSPTERMRITSDAYVRLASGTGGIQFNGDTAAANALDDYEEGSWTPVIVGTTAAGTGTYSRQVGRYTKIGSRVVAEGVCTWSAHTGTGNIKMTGLPFTLSNAANYLTAVALHVNNITSPAGTIVQAYSPGNLTEIVFTSVATGGGAFASLAMDTAGEFIVSISYTVA